MTLEFASDSASAKLNLTIKTGDWFSGNTTNFGGSPQSKALININIKTGDIFSNNRTTIRR